MEPRPRRTRTADLIREERATNKVFGLNDPERWSGCKQLIDFVDDLFSLRRRPAVKLERPVSGIIVGPRYMANRGNTSPIS